MKRFSVRLLTMLSLLNLVACTTLRQSQQEAWIRINQLGYTPKGIKVAVLGIKSSQKAGGFELVRAGSNKVVFSGSTGEAFGAYGPFQESYRLRFSQFTDTGNFYIRVGKSRSPVFRIAPDVYVGTADFALRYLRQQRSLYNPYLKDSCHTHDGFTLYASHACLPDSTVIDVGGGWHDASDYLQYSSTSANATYHLLAAYRDFPAVFGDGKQANGLDGGNGRADVLDEAKWGLDWLMKMHPGPHLLFNQIADDRDHAGMRMPGEDSLYGRGYERPVYFIDGKPQQRGKFMNNTTGTSSTAAKFTSAFNLGSALFETVDKGYADQLRRKAISAYDFARLIPGATQTVSVKSPYIYAEDNWVDDMELAAATNWSVTGQGQFAAEALHFARQEKITPWLETDTAAHYQWYPFINLGHYELAKQLKGKEREEIISFYKEGIEKVWNRASKNAFYRGVPFIWCSNNLTVSFAMQCLWYKDLSGDDAYSELEQANFDWLFGCNPWGTSMVYGLPAHGDAPTDPHSAFTHLGNFPIDGGLVDGPVYGRIFNSLIGIQLVKPDEYAPFQSDLAVYHDDYGDYSTNEPTMDGTASLVYLMASKEQESTEEARNGKKVILDPYGAIVRGDTTKKEIALVFTGDEYNDGTHFIERTLAEQGIKGAFFLTGRFLDNKDNNDFVQNLLNAKHYIGVHSDQHLLYCDWKDRDKLLITKTQFFDDLNTAYAKLSRFGIDKSKALLFLPPYEWYNSQIVTWTEEWGLQLVNFSWGTLSTADYTYPEMGDKYRNNATICRSIEEYEERNGLNGFFLLIHLGADARRKIGFYLELPDLIKKLKHRGYVFKRMDEMLN